jgi:hypothetical protein
VSGGARFKEFAISDDIRINIVREYNECDCEMSIEGNLCNFFIEK